MRRTGSRSPVNKYQRQVRRRRNPPPRMSTYRIDTARRTPHGASARARLRAVPSLLSATHLGLECKEARCREQVGRGCVHLPQQDLCRAPLLRLPAHFLVDRAHDLLDRIKRGGKRCAQRGTALALGRLPEEERVRAPAREMAWRSATPIGDCARRRQVAFTCAARAGRAAPRATRSPTVPPQR